MAMDEKGLGKHLQAARQAAGLTQQQLCARANLSFSTLTKIERGAIKSPSIFTVQSIAGAVGVSLDELVGAAPALARTLTKTKNGVSFIYFDVNGCLVHSFHEAIIELAKTSGASADAVETAFWHYNADVCRGVMSMNDFNARMAERLDITEVDWQKYYFDTIRPVTQMQELLGWASQRYKVGLLTNIMPGQLATMKRSGHIPNIAYDAIIDSSEVGSIKPEPEIYQIAQEKAGCPPEEILLIDDSRANLMAAERLGWKVMWFDDSRADEAAERVREAIQPA